MAAILEDGKLTLSGYVGDDWFDDGFTYDQVLLALAQIDEDDDLVVHINSAGGIATEGAAIHSLLSGRPGKTDVVIEGIAASAASLIAMAGKTVTMALGAIMMIHDPAGMTWGTSKDHAKTIEGLEALATAYARVYAAKSGKTADECRDIMRDERWFTPEQAMAEGFADAVSQTRAEAVAAFDYRQFTNAPQRLVALATKKDWRLPDASAPAASAAQPSQRKEKSMTDKERADQLAAELAELKAQMKTGRDAEAAATMEQELEALRAEKAARENADAIMALDEATGREDQAKALAEAGVSAEKAKIILAAAPQPTSGRDDDLVALEGRRLNGEGLNGKGGGAPKAKGDKSVLSEAVARANKRR